MGEVPGEAASESLLGPRFPPPDRPRRRPRGRPVFGLVVVVAVAARLGDDVVQVAVGPAAGLVVGLTFLVTMVLWRTVQRARVRRQGEVELTPDDVTAQIEASGLGPPAFAEDGTVLGASMLVVSQRTKVLEMVTEYELFGSDGKPLGVVRQTRQSQGKLLARFFTNWDQFFTHHFDVVGPDGQAALRLTRPRKVFRSKIQVFDGWNNHLGTIQQMNVFWKINFELRAPNGQVVGFLRAQNVRAWDFHIYDWFEREVATVVKSWEGWARTAFSRADRYVVRIHEPLPDPLRSVTVAAAVAIDVALKQDARGLG